MKATLKRALSVLCALALCIGLLPVSALAATQPSTGNCFTLDYDNEGTQKRTVTVNLYKPSGNLLDTLTVHDSRSRQQEYTITLSDATAEEYDIESVSVDGGNLGDSTLAADSYKFWLGLVSEDSSTVNVQLCPQFVPPTVDDPIEHESLIYYRITEVSLLKLLHDSGIDVDANTEILGQQGVKLHFVEEYGESKNWPLDRVPTGADNIMYYENVTGLSNYGGAGGPNNIRYIEIPYRLSDGTEGTQRVYSGDLYYTKVDFDTYEIESVDQSERIVAFYTEPGGQSTTWQLYDVEFVPNGQPLGLENMPEDPTFPNTEYVFTNWANEPTGGEPFLPFEEVTEDKVVYAQKTSSEWGGTRYQVMNPDNDMIDRFLEIYNAANDTEATASDVDMESVRIQVNGTDIDDKPGHTNPNYWNNRWVGDNEYYRVVNSHIVGNHGTVSNTHIPHDKAESITIFANVDGKNVEVTIPIDNSVPGGVHIGQNILDNIAQIFVNDPPEPPSEEELITPPDGLLDENAVKVDCVTTAEHPDKISGLLDGSFTPPTAEDIQWENEGDFGYYYIDLVVSNEEYVKAYNEEYPDHTLELGEDETKTIRLKCVSVAGGQSEWEVATATPVTFEVICDNPDPGEDLNGTDVTVQVYVDEQKVTNPLAYVTLSRDTKDTDYNKWSREVSADGTVTCDFDYNADGGYNCVDIKVNVANDDTYLLQGIRSYQSYGASGTDNVRNNNDGTYTIDNVTAYKDHVIIFLYTKYSVEYYKGTEKLTDDYTDSTVYIIGESTKATTSPDAIAEGGSSPMQWKNPAAYETSITLKDLPTEEGKDVTGWFLGIESGTEYDPSTTSSVNVEDVIPTDESRTIKFYAKVSDPEENRKVEITKTAKVDGNEIAADQKVNVGDTITYEIKVTNTGNVDLEDVVITDDMWSNGKVTSVKVNGTPANLTDGKYTIEDLNKGITVTITYTYTVKIADQGDTIHNAASVEGDDIDDGDGDEEDVEVYDLNVEKKLTGITRDGEPLDGPFTDEMKVYVGDKLTWTITVTNNGDKAVNDLKLTDVLTAGDAEIQNGATITAPTGVSADNFTVPEKNGDTPGKVEFTATYTVGDDVEPGVTLKNAATVSDKGDEPGDDDPKDETENEVGNPNLEVTKTADKTTAKAGDTITYTVVVKNLSETEALESVTVSDGMWKDEAVAGTVAVKIDGSEVEATVTNNSLTITNIPAGKSATITYSYTVTADDVLKGSIVNNVTVDGGDDGTDDDEVTVLTAIIGVQPADITIYTGGKGYTSVVDGVGSASEPESDGDESTGLPEPGYYITLPDEINDALHKAYPGTADENGAIDLSGILSFSYDFSGETRTWTLERYDEDGDSTAYGKYIYRLVPAEDQQNVRLLFTDENGAITSDEFTPALDGLFKEYSMSIYAGNLNQNEVKAHIKLPGDGQANPEYTVDVEAGELTIRGVTKAVETIPLNGTAGENGFSATVHEDASYTVNGSEVGVNDHSGVHLLVDGLVESSVADVTAAVYGALDDAAEKALAAADIELDGMDCDYAYMNLVDNNNGNVYVTSSRPVTITWPMPGNASASDDFYIVHFLDLNRGQNLEAGMIEGSDTEVLSAEVTDGGTGITFTTKSFSPFVLVYGDEVDGGDEPVNPPHDDDEDEDDDRPAHRPHRPDRDDEPEELNTEDHVAYLIGFTDGTIRPEANISRAEVATIFFRLLTDEARETYWSQYSPYSDVKADAWYNNAVCTLSNMGILDGYPDGTFRPDAPITRSEFTKVAISFFDYAEGYYVYGGEFSDVTGAEWFASYLAAALDYGLIEGMPDGTFRPLNNISRAEACTIVNRTLGREPDGDHLLSRREMITWPDNSTSAWYYADMQEATNSHDYYWDEDDEVEEWTEKLEERDWAALERSWSNAYDAPGGEVMD